MYLLSIFFVRYGLVLTILLLLFLRFRNAYKLFKGFPVYHIAPYLVYWQVFRKIPKNLPSSSIFLTKVTEECLKYYSKEGLCMIYLFEPILLIFGKETAQVFSNAKSADCKPELYFLLGTDLFGQGLILNGGEKWKKVRKMINPAFSLKMLKARIPLFNEHAASFAKHSKTLVGEETSYITEIIKLHYFNALMESVFGFKQTEDNKAENMKFFDNIGCVGESTIYRLTNPWLLWKFLLKTFPRGRKILHAYEEVDKFTKNSLLKMEAHIKTERETLSENLINSLTYMLLKYRQDDPTFTLEDMINECRTFMIAGYETASNCTMWCLFNLGLYPEIQEKAYNEIHFTLTKTYVTFEDLSNLGYLEAIILETLRLYPTVPIFGRQLSDDVQCGQRKVPKGTVLAFAPYTLHRNPELYHDPEKFDPERFLGSKQNSGIYIPFAEGYRNCIGKKYALMEMKIFLAYFIRNFKITSITRKEDVDLCWSVTLMPVKPLLMKIEQR